MGNIIKIFFLLLFSVLFSKELRGAELFKDGKSDYTIILFPTASESERTAAEELRQYIQKINGADIPIKTNYLQNNKHCIYIGFHPFIAKVIGASKPDNDDDGFTYKTIDDNLYIYGGAARGTMYGVFTFMEKEFGVKWYTKSCTIIPKIKKYALRKITHSEHPKIKYRFVEFYNFSSDSALYAHNKMNMVWDALPTKYGKLHNYWGVHTSEWLIPSKKYYAAHPEYFSLRNGKREPNSQLCLTNPDVLKLVIKNLKSKINPVINYWCYDVSQNDNQLFCECSECKKLEAQYGGHSGIWIWFVNQVAEALPNINIGTFAYQYTRHAPKNITPRENVVIRLCSVECCFAHPIELCPKNQSFLKDYKAWRNITNKIFIWDYVVNFNQYLLPFPNFAVLKSNIQFFVKNKAIAVFELGQYNSGNGEFSEMKAWVISKLLWNPNLNTDDLVKEFIRGYYGNAANEVYEYYRLCQNLVLPNTHFDCYIKGTNKIFTDDFIENAKKIIKKAYKKCNNKEIQRRVKMIDLQILYLEFTRDRMKSVANGSYFKLLKIIEEEKPHINEGIDADSFIQKNGYI